MNKLSVCPDINAYRDLASGQLPAETKESLLRHLEGCDSCVRKVQTLPAQDSLIACIQQIKTSSGAPHEKQLAPLIQRLIQLRQAGAAPKARTFAFSCPGCGKALRVKEEAAGKKVKCPHCGKVAQTPAAGRPEGAAETPPAAQETGVFTPAEAGASAPITKAGLASVADLNRSSEETQFHTSSKDQKLCSFLAPAQAPDELGRLGPYRVLKVLGAGGMGVVFRAEDPQLQRLVALKAMLPDLAANESARQRFLREARAAAKLKHDHIVSIYQVGEDRGAPFLAMEFLEGEALEDRIKRAAPDEGTSPLPLAEILRIGREIAEGLEAAHEHGLIHRDIKPGNVWLEGKRGRVKILDFGLARSANEDVHLTQSGAIVGTPAYMPPEQARGEAVDGRCDLYSLGCVLYRLCTGQLPFKGDNTMSLLLALATEQPKSVRELNADVPAALADLIMRLLAKDAAQRPATAREVAEALDAIDTGEPVVVKAARAPAPPRRRRRRAMAVAGGALLLTVLLTVIVIRLGKPEEGSVAIETVDPNVQLVFTSGGREVTVRDGKDGAEFKLPLGSYQVALKDGKGGFQLKTDHFTLKRGERVLVKVMRQAGTPPAEARADIPPPVQVPEPPPLAEWLKGRKVLTVAQDGSGQFKTIKAALDALKPHQVVKVLDRGPYRESLQVGALPADTGLISEQQTVLEIPSWPNGTYSFGPLDGFRLSGFRLLWPPPNARWNWMTHWSRPSGLVIEDCCFALTKPSEAIAIHLMFENSEPDFKPVVVRNCRFDFAGIGFDAPAGSVPTVVLQRNYFKHAYLASTSARSQKVLIRHNVFDLPKDGIWVEKLKEVSEILEISNNTFASPPSSISIVQSAPKSGIVIRNNCSDRGIGLDGKALADAGDSVKNWQLDHNCYIRRGSLPKASSDVVEEPPFLSLDPSHPDFLRIAADGPAAKGGAGGAWPSYIGAFPPGPAPKDGDWFTRLREKWLKNEPEAGK
jgi:ribosomal protein S27E